VRGNRGGRRSAVFLHVAALDRVLDSTWILLKVNEPSSHCDEAVDLTPNILYGNTMSHSDAFVATGKHSN